MIMAVVTFHAGLLAVILIPMSVAVQERDEQAKARQLRGLACALGLVVVAAQVEQWDISLVGRIAVAALAVASLLLPLRRHPA